MGRAPTAIVDTRAKRWTVAEVVEAKRAVDGLLGDLGLDAYLFSVEPSGDAWSVVVECASSEGWKTTTLTVDDETLWSSRENRASRRRLLGEWSRRLAGRAM
jgi:hypothetical protein